jgi:hypothetical protein
MFGWPPAARLHAAVQGIPLSALNNADGTKHRSKLAGQVRFANKKRFAAPIRVRSSGPILYWLVVDAAGVHWPILSGKGAIKRRSNSP